MKVIVLNMHGARLDAFGTYGGSLATTPHFDQFAARSMVFDQHYAHRLPSLTGDDIPDPCEEALDILTARLTTGGNTSAYFADHRVMDALGYTANWKHVGIVSEQDLTALSQPTLCDAVLQQSIDWLQDFGVAYEHWLLNIELGALLAPWREEEYVPAPSSSPEEDTSTEPVFEMEDSGESPAPQRSGWRLAYGGVVRYLDDLLGQFMKLLDELELTDECMIVIQSPLGQSLGEYGPVVERSTGIFEERCHLPLLIKFPKGAGAGRRVHHFTHPDDVLATIYQMLLGEACEQLQADHLYRYTQGQAGRFREYAVTLIPDQDDLLEASLRAKHWSLTVPFTDLTGRPIQLYRKPEDRWDMNNVAKEHVDVAEHLELTLHRYLLWRAQGSVGEEPGLRNEVVQVLAQ